MTGPPTVKAWSASIPYLETRFPYMEHKNTAQVLNDVAQYLCDNWPRKTSDKPGDPFILHRDNAAFITYALPGGLKGRIETTTLVGAVAFLLDDAVESQWTLAEKKQLFGRISGLVLGTTTPIPRNQYEAVIVDVFARFRATDKPGHPALGVKCCDEFIRWVNTATKQKNRVYISSQDSLEEYIECRYTDVGVWYRVFIQVVLELQLKSACFRWTYSLLCWGYDLSLPEHIQDDPDMRAVDIIGARHAMLVNDLFSYDVEVNAAKENSKSGVDNMVVNAIPVVMKEKSLKEEEAVKLISSHIHQLEDEFLEIEAKLNAKYSGDDQKTCGRYITALKHLFGGNLEWSRHCVRYHPAAE
ncbi:isoprenoid synthase domain-containing protein [Crucibulum laeve]|uniref:Terpene synthase n=1 Tax=Crucibulum laeve TaxID=68775 RepID=A0A5C3LY69_9AGAR|nr:isoprenoid synthase domain-containing protein [Crucibulum laeve]